MKIAAWPSGMNGMSGTNVEIECLLKRIDAIKSDSQCQINWIDHNIRDNERIENQLMEI
jgi:hypothetical protein